MQHDNLPSLRLLLLCALAAPTMVSAKVDNAITVLETTKVITKKAITLSGVRNIALEDSPGSASVISEEKIAVGHFMSSADALSALPGVRAMAEFGRGLRPNIGIRGVNPNRSRNVLVLADGIPVQPAVYGDPSMYYNVSIESVEQIEVMKGATSVIYGPNTSAGVINYKMRRPPQEAQARITETIRQGGFAVTELSLGNTWNGVGAQISYLNKSGHSLRENTDTEVNELNMRLLVPTANDGEISMRMNYYRELSQTPGGISLAEFNKDPNKSERSHDNFNGRRGSFDLRYQQPINSDWSIDTLAYMNFFERNWSIAKGSDLSGATSNSHYLREFFVAGLEPRIRWKNWLAGVKIHHEQQANVVRKGSAIDSRTGTTSDEADLSTNALAAYLETNLTLSEQLTVTPGIRYESLTQMRNGALKKGKSHETYDAKDTNVFTWGVSGLFKANDIVNVYAGVHKAFQPPTFKEAVDPTSGVANDIDAETSINYEIGMRVNTDSQLHAELTLFQTNFDNQIAKDAGIVKNIGETRQSGVELSVSAPWNNWLFDANATLLDTEILTGNNRGNQLVMAPEQTYNAGMQYQTILNNDLESYVRLEGQYIGTQFTDTANTVTESANGYNGMLPSYTVLNLKGEIKHGDWKVFAGINNLLDKHYRVRRQGFFGGIIPGATRSVYVGASLTF